MKKFVVTSNRVNYISVKDTEQEAQAVADKLNAEYYQHKIWNVEECEFD